MLPRTFSLSRSHFISQSPEFVFNIMADFNRYGEWSPWQHLDPQVKVTVEGAPRAVGSRYAWKGNSRVGQGTMVITGIEKPGRINVEVAFLRPFKATNEVIWLLEKQDSGCKVTWTMQGTYPNMLQRLFAFFMNMDRMLGKNFDDGLALLKGIAEKKA